MHYKWKKNNEMMYNFLLVNDNRLIYLKMMRNSFFHMLPVLQVSYTLIQVPFALP